MQIYAPAANEISEKKMPLQTYQNMLHGKVAIDHTHKWWLSNNYCSLFSQASLA